MRDSHSPLTFTTLDKNEESPPLDQIGTRWQHSGNMKVYMLVGYVWNGDTDEWNMLMNAPEGVGVVRPMNHLYGSRADGSQRYFQVF